jgi:hypothetical protein
MRRRRWLPIAVLVSSLAGGDAALGQTPAPPPSQLPPPGPDLVMSGRDVRMTRAGVLGLRVGCRQTVTPGEICVGTVTVRLDKAVVIEVPPPPNAPPNARPRMRRINPYTIGTVRFSMSVGSAPLLRLQVNRRTGDIVKQLGSIRVRLIGAWTGRANVPSQSQRTIRVYYPTRPEL